MQVQVEKMIKKLEDLSPDRIAEVADFIDFLHHKDKEKNLIEDFTRASEASFAQVWDNDDDAAYDTL